MDTRLEPHPDAAPGTVADLARRLVATESTPTAGEAAALAVARAEMERLGYDHVGTDAGGNLVGRIGDGSPPVLVIDSHIDTVPLHEAARWSVDPFAATVRDGRLVALGACDMKGPLAATIVGAAQARDAGPLRGTVLVVASLAEELMEGAALARGFDDERIDLCLIAEPTSLRLATAQRGRAKLEVEVHGRAAHAASAFRGVNAVAQAAAIIRAAAGLPEVEHPLLGRRDVNVIDIASEPYPSMSTIPSGCLLRFDVRFVPPETPESLLATFRGLVPDGVDADVRFYRAEFTTVAGDSYAVDEFAGSWETPRDHPLVSGALAATGAEAWAYRFCTNGSYFAAARGIPTIGYGPGDPDDAHAVDESVALADLETAADGYAGIVRSALAGR
jgi:putative selenium metabolism hydrolase